MSHTHDGINYHTSHDHGAPVTHTHDGINFHSSHDHGHVPSGFNAAEHGHSHEILDGPGSYLARELPIVEGRDFNERAFTVGIGGCVGPRRANGE
jgi:urease accessory protein